MLLWCRQRLSPCCTGDYRISVVQHVCHNMFCQRMRSCLHLLLSGVICAPGFEADPAMDGTKDSNFSIINFAEKTILVGGSAYTGEIKKGIFSVLNYTLPEYDKVLAMHCSANMGNDGDTALFFGLSGTGKTTLSADPDRALMATTNMVGRPQVYLISKEDVMPKSLI